MIIGICRFQPFASRDDSVVGLSFRYDQDFIDTLKIILRRYDDEARDDKRRIRVSGNWLPPKKVWFVENVVWPKVKADLRHEYPDITYVVVPPPA